MGTLGLWPADTTPGLTSPIAAAVSQGLIQKTVFTVNFPKGVLTYGGIDSANCDADDIGYQNLDPLPALLWQIKMDR